MKPRLGGKIRHQDRRYTAKWVHLATSRKVTGFVFFNGKQIAVIGEPLYREEFQRQFTVIVDTRKREGVDHE
jgi:hypothetical protein